jgi:protein AFG1
MDASREASFFSLLTGFTKRVVSSSYNLLFDFPFIHYIFAVTDIADAMILQRLFGMLWRAGIIVVATSNRAPHNLYQGGINRSRFVPFITLLQQHMQVIHLQGDIDYRTVSLPNNEKEEENDNNDNNLSTSPMCEKYFYPSHSTETRQSLQRWVDSEMNNQPTPNVTKTEVVWNEENVPVRMGRRVHVQRATTSPVTFQSMAWLEFEDICGTPLGAADYLALCQRYDTIVLDQVPQLTQHNYNQARRFVTLIDALYETKTRLIMAMEVPLEQLFVEFDVSVTTNDGDEEIAIADATTAVESVVTAEGGASSSHATTLVQDPNSTGPAVVEWSATGRMGVSLAQLSAVRDVTFSFQRAQSRLVEIRRPSWGRGHNKRKS